MRKTLILIIKTIALCGMAFAVIISGIPNVSKQLISQRESRESDRIAITEETAMDFPILDAADKQIEMTEDALQVQSLEGENEKDDEIAEYAESENDEEAAEYPENKDAEPNGDEKREVPNVVGMSEQKARQKMTDEGFTVQVLYEYNAEPSPPPGYCYCQGVPPGTLWNTNDIIEIYIQTSETTEKYRIDNVPKVIGLSESEAIKKLKALGFNNIEVFYCYSIIDVPPGFCTEQSIPAGGWGWNTDLIHLGIQTEPVYYTVPNVVGLEEGMVWNVLIDNLFTGECVYKYDPDSTYPPGYCTGQSQKAGAKTADTRITFYIQTEPPVIPTAETTIEPSTEP